MSKLKIGLVYSFFIIGWCLLYRFVNKDSLVVVINRSLPEKEAGLLMGVIVGEKQSMSKEFYELLKISGLVHLVIVSGSNVMLLSRGLIENFAGYVGRKKLIIIVLGLAWSYAAMVGWEIPVVRAVLMVSIYYWAQLLGKKFDVVRALGLVIIVMLLAKGQMVKEVGFWLSILAFGAVVTGRGLNIFWLTIWVSIWITPILTMIFGKISLIGPLTNTAVLFLVELITAMGMLGAVVGIFWFEAGKIVLWLIYPLLKYFVWVVEWGGKAKWVSVSVGFNWWILAGWYLVLGYWLIKKNNAK